jgi:hypothetical protein
MKEIKDFPGYFITEDGKVFSYLTYHGKINYESTPRIIKPFTTHDGYLRISLRKNKKSKKKYIHQLVSETYVENINKLETVNHKDKNKLNNHFTNLEWMSTYDNCVYSFCKFEWVIEKIDDNTIIKTDNLRSFCRENNLAPHAMRKTLCGLYKQHKGFRVIEKKLINQQSD